MRCQMARAIGARKVHRYGNDFKAQAVRLSQVKGVQIKDVAESLEIHPFMLSRWRKEFREGKIVRKGNLPVEPKTVAELRRLRKLEREYALLKEEHALLKKLIRFCSEQKQRCSPLSSRTGKNIPSA